MLRNDPVESIDEGVLKLIPVMDTESAEGLAELAWEWVHVADDGINSLEVHQLAGERTFFKLF
jgi:hypothetical protein